MDGYTKRTGLNPATDFSVKLYFNGTLVSSPSVTISEISGSSGEYAVSVPGFPTNGYWQIEILDNTTHDNWFVEVEVADSLPAQVLNALLTSYLTSGSVGEALAITRGLVQQNFVLDSTVYNDRGVMTSGRIRIFNSAADVTTQGSTPLATFQVTTVTSTTEHDEVLSYTVVKQ